LPVGDALLCSLDQISVLPGEWNRRFMRVVAVLAVVAALVSSAAAQDVPKDSAKDAAKDTAKQPQQDTTKPISVDEVFRQFDLFGVWAVACDAPPSPENPHLSIISPAAGVVVEKHDIGEDYEANAYSILSAERLSPTSLAVEVVFQPGSEREERQKLVFRIRDNTRRTMFNQPEGGAVRVKDGIALANRSRTPLLRKCE
jgi:hypothetical protein